MSSLGKVDLTGKSNQGWVKLPRLDKVVNPARVTLSRLGILTQAYLGAAPGYLYPARVMLPTLGKFMYRILLQVKLCLEANKADTLVTKRLREEDVNFVNIVFALKLRCFVAI